MPLFTPDKNDRITLEAPRGIEKNAVDRETGFGVINGVSLVSLGEAAGHGAEIDKDFLEDLVEMVNLEQDGLLAYLTHDQKFIDRLGRYRNPRIEGSRAKADLHFFKAAHNAPQGGDLAGWVMDMAEDDPRGFGVSLSFQADRITQTSEKRLPRWKLAAVYSGDIVGRPAANPEGLLEAKRLEAGIMTLEELQKKLGATETKLEAANSQLTEERKKLAEQQQKLTVALETIAGIQAAETKRLEAAWTSKVTDAKKHIAEEFGPEETMLAQVARAEKLHAQAPEIANEMLEEIIKAKASGSSEQENRSNSTDTAKLDKVAANVLEVAGFECEKLSDGRFKVEVGGKKKTYNF